jgi:hypothetical protein
MVISNLNLLGLMYPASMLDQHNFSSSEFNYAMDISPIEHHIVDPNTLHLQFDQHPDQLNGIFLFDIFIHSYFYCIVIIIYFCLYLYFLIINFFFYLFLTIKLEDLSAFCDFQLQPKMYPSPPYEANILDMTHIPWDAHIAQL